MKNLLICLMLLSLVSCMNERIDDDLSNVEFMQLNDSLKRDDLIKMKIDDQRAIFNNLNPETKCMLYKYKISKDIQSDSLSKKEKRHLIKLYNTIEPSIYAEKDEFNKLGAKWLEEARDELKWDEKDIFTYSMTIMTKDEFNRYLKNNPNYVDGH